MSGSGREGEDGVGPSSDPPEQSCFRTATRKGNEGTALNERPQGYQSEAQPGTKQGALRKQTAKTRSPS